MNTKNNNTKKIHVLMENLRTYYVFPEMAEKICVHLQEQLEHGTYDDINEGQFLAYALTADMQAVCQDEHLWVKWHQESLPLESETLRLNKEWVAQEKLQAEKSNFGFHKVARLAGNIGYLDLRYFQRPEWGGETAVAAMNFLAATEALILDLRQCPGGHPGMVALISSYLLGGKPTLLNNIYWRDDNETRQYWTLPYIPGKNFAEKPLYILVGKDTFSGGEGFAYDMQARARATIIGEQTDGGAHPGASYRLSPHFEVFIPIGCPTHPITGTNWEGVGVVPDIATASAQALEKAHKMALEALIEKLGKPKSGPLRSLLAEARAAHKNIDVK
jgi:C-terminal processing protease CtpA/Prc